MFILVKHFYKIKVATKEILKYIDCLAVEFSIIDAHLIEKQ